MSKIRLDRLISDATTLSRSEARCAIKSGRVMVCATAIKAPDAKADPELEIVTLDGRAITYKKFYYIMMNKPAGVLSATEDEAQGTVLDLLPPMLRSRGIFPVGRLDKDTTGLLVLTDDGEFSHRITSPRHGIKKQYLAQVDIDITDEDVKAFSDGITLRDGTVCRSAVLKGDGAGRCIVEISEGKYHQVRRMLAARGKKVLALHRRSVGALSLSEKLLPGEFRELSAGELEAIFEI